MRLVSKLAVLAAAAAIVFTAPAMAGTPSWSIYGGYSNLTGDGSPDGSFGARVNAFHQVNSVIGIGGEVGYHKFGSIEIYDEVAMQNADLDLSAWQFTPMVRARGMTGTVRPYGMIGLGLYPLRASMGDLSDTETEFGFNIGAGATFGQGPTTFGVEARWHSIQTEGDASDVISIMGGVNFN